MDNESRQKSQVKSEKSLHELLDSTNVDIYVGEEKIRWSLPKKLLCHYSPVFEEAFNSGANDEANDDGSVTPSQSNQGGKKSYNLLDEENATFELLIAYFYARTLPPATSEKGVGPLLDLYLLALRLEIEGLSSSVVDAVREWYHKSSTYPGLRRVQYIYANTDEDNEMREMMVSSVARQLTTTESIPLHWAKALQRNGQLAVDIIRSIQQWHLEERNIPDVRDGSIGRDRKMKGGFSAVERQEDSVETEASGMHDSAIGLESQDGEAGEHTKAEAENGTDAAKEVASEAIRIAFSASSLHMLQAQLKRPPDKHKLKRSKSSASLPSIPEATVAEVGQGTSTTGSELVQSHYSRAVLDRIAKRAQIGLLVILWLIYLLYWALRFIPGLQSSDT